MDSAQDAQEDHAAEENGGSKDPLAVLDEYDFELPETHIAQTPMQDREAARLLVLDRSGGRILAYSEDHRIRDLPSWLRAGDLLVVNATRVLPARLVGQKASGGAAEALLLGPASSTDPNRDAADYRALVKCTGRIREGLSLSFGEHLELTASLVSIHDRGEVTLRFAPGVDPYAHGEAPLPPYIRRQGEASAADDLTRYQTVYAREPGAIAAPTAGLHFTTTLFDRLREKGVGVAEVVLHVGAGTFRPLNAAAMKTGRLHQEHFELPAETVDAIEKTHASGGRVVAVGTTTARVLESQVAEDGHLKAGSGVTDLFIRPGAAPFRVVDALLTNFHLPRSSLLLLVAAFVGRRPLLNAYEVAIQQGFRFYSYGDAMLIVSDADEQARP
jgi:S-adenosylmethionine:tRNA ribosyltransferase-isomerase